MATYQDVLDASSGSNLTSPRWAGYPAKTGADAPQMAQDAPQANTKEIEDRKQELRKKIAALDSQIASVKSQISENRISAERMRQGDYSYWQGVKNTRDANAQRDAQNDEAKRMNAESAQFSINEISRNIQDSLVGFEKLGKDDQKRTIIAVNGMKEQIADIKNKFGDLVKIPELSETPAVGNSAYGLLNDAMESEMSNAEREKIWKLMEPLLDEKEKQAFKQKLFSIKSTEEKKEGAATATAAKEKAEKLKKAQNELKALEAKKEIATNKKNWNELDSLEKQIEEKNKEIAELE